MENEREKLQSTHRMPENVYEQLANLPDAETQAETCKWLFDKITQILCFNGVDVDFDKSSFRIKTPERIEEKVKIRGSEAPVRDIYGVRFVVSEGDRTRIAGMITREFPDTPKVFQSGHPRVRDYADPAMREFIKNNFNPRISNRHSALHINVVFPRDRSEMFDIGEVQIMTAKELAIYNETRGEYENGRRGSQS